MSTDDAGSLRSDLTQRFQQGELLAGRYRIVQFIGAGGMGEVYAAQDETLGVLIALKTLRGELALDPLALDGFRRELLVLRQVTHPNVCRVFDYGAHGDSQFFTMEFIDGESLRHRLTRGGPMTTDVALPLVQQLAAGLSAAHQRGVVHRDFKSANILLGPSGRAVITDFGLARNLRSEQADAPDGVGLGTPTYMAPELMEEKPAGPRADLYSFGVVLYEMVTGAVPWTGATPIAIAARKIRDTPAAPSLQVPGLPRRWDQTILRCLQFRPEDRFADALDIAAALDSRSPLSPRRLAAAALAIGALALGTYASWNWYSNRSNTSAEAVAAMREGAWHRAEGLLRSQPSADAQARLAETLLELDRIEEAKDIVLTLPNTRRVAATRLLVQRRFAQAAGAFAGLPGAALDACRIRAKADAPAALLCYDAYLRNAPNDGAALLQSGLLLARQRQVPPALQRLAQAELQFRAATNVEGIAEARLGRAAALQHQKNWNESRTALIDALQLANAAKLDYAATRIQFALARNAIFAGEMAEATAYAAAGATRAKEKGFGFLVAQSRNDLGSILLAQYKLVEARAEFEMAKKYAQDARSTSQEARAELSLASVAMRQKRVADALPAIRSGLAYYERNGFRDQTLSAKFLLIDALMDKGGLREARGILSSLRQDASLQQDHVAQTRILEREHYFALWAEDFAAAKAIQQQLISLYGKSGERQSLAYAWINLAEVECRAGQSGTDSLARGRSLAGPSADAVLARGHLVEADCALRARHFAEAESAARAALKANLASPSRDALAWSALAQSLAARRRPGAIEACEKALAATAELAIRSDALARCAAAATDLQDRPRAAAWAAAHTAINDKLTGESR